MQYILIYVIEYFSLLDILRNGREVILCLTLLFVNEFNVDLYFDKSCCLGLSNDVCN